MEFEYREIYDFVKELRILLFLCVDEIIINVVAFQIYL